MFHFHRKNQDAAAKPGDQGSQESRQHASSAQRASHDEQHPTSHPTSGHGDPLLASTQGHHSTHDPRSSAGHHGSGHDSQSTTETMRQSGHQAASSVGGVASSTADTVREKAKQATGSVSSAMPAQLQDGLRRSAEQASAYLQSLKEVVASHDREHDSSTPSSGMNHEIASAESSVEAASMKRLSEDFRRKGHNVSDDMMAQARKSVEDMMDTLNHLAERARAYEDTQSPSPTGPSTMQVTKEKLVGATHSVQSSAVSMMNTTREKAQSGFETLKRQLSPSQQSTTKDSAMESLHTTKDKAAETTEAAKQKAAGKAPSSQEQQQGGGIKEKAAQMLNTSLDYVADTLHGLKVEAAEPSTADKAKDQATSASSNVKDKAREMTSSGQQSKSDQAQSPLSSHSP